jgi:hypothetical protein
MLIVEKTDVRHFPFKIILQYRLLLLGGVRSVWISVAACQF